MFLLRYKTFTAQYNTIFHYIKIMNIAKHVVKYIKVIYFCELRTHVIQILQRISYFYNYFRFSCLYVSFRKMNFSHSFDSYNSSLSLNEFPVQLLFTYRQFFSIYCYSYLTGGQSIQIVSLLICQFPIYCTSTYYNICIHGNYYFSVFLQPFFQTL